MALLPPEGRRVHLAYAGQVRTDFRLLEVDEAVLQEIVQQGVVIKGDADAEAFLVTNDKSYCLKYVETSNLQLLLQPSLAATQDGPDSEDEGMDDATPSQELVSPAGLQTQKHRMKLVKALPHLRVGATSQAHIELCETQPRFQALHSLLSERPYRGDEEDEEHGGQRTDSCMTQEEPCAMDVDGEQRPGSGCRRARGRAGGAGLYTLEDILARVQASRTQVLQELRALHALELGGVWRLVDPGYLGQLLELLILSAVSEGLPLDSLDPSVLCDVLATDGYRRELVLHCLGVYGNEKSDQPGCWTLDEIKVCRYFARKVLPAPITTVDTAAGSQPQPGAGVTAGAVRPGPGMPMQRFLTAWSAAVPGGMHATWDMLKGEVLVDGKGPDALVCAFPVSQLPTHPASRFSLLFSVRSQWESSDLEPYLVGLQAPGLTSGALLLKYARASQPTPDSPVYFTAR